MLSIQELKEITSLIKRLKPGKYELKEIYGELWNSIEVKKRRVIGKFFKESVLRNEFIDVAFDKTRTDNHAIYFVKINLQKKIK